ncbi:DinB family protein [Alkalicoccus daliensis]|uniref:Uncharacterized damage-inducible protein DinB (Forms a four-helix bundle) n=1 Tax=Alkalicoccus daliensis TaxID=745820 RepID=A0A1H0G158_9BACI|nr:DinB family protein [Alkalicoccus daliensis]SDO00469.1 Uncharacterized damage-inducible protein DinB (forms a four-helix bundle) [Alkalicoccus daliensis]
MKKDNKYYKEKFLSHRKVTRSLVNKIPEAHLNHKPTATAMTAEELIMHTLDITHHIICLAAQRPYQKLYCDTEKVSLLELVDRYTDTSVKLLEGIDEEMMQHPIDASQTLGIKAPAWRLVEIAVEHEINHKGNLFVYVREMGYNHLPSFVKL